MEDEKYLVLPQWAIEEGIEKGIVYQKDGDYYWEGLKIMINNPLKVEDENTRK